MTSPLATNHLSTYISTQEVVTAVPSIAIPTADNATSHRRPAWKESELHHVTSAVRTRKGAGEILFFAGTLFPWFRGNPKGNPFETRCPSSRQTGPAGALPMVSEPLQMV